MHRVIIIGDRIDGARRRRPTVDGVLSSTPPPVAASLLACRGERGGGAHGGTCRSRCRLPRAALRFHGPERLDAVGRSRAPATRRRPAASGSRWSRWPAGKASTAASRREATRSSRASRCRNLLAADAGRRHADFDHDHRGADVRRPEGGAARESRRREAGVELPDSGADGPARDRGAASGRPVLPGHVFLRRPAAADLAVLKRAQRLLKDTPRRGWERRAPDLPLATPYEALILASIVEKETGRAADRPLIASVFVNRLRAGHAAADRSHGDLRTRRERSTATCASATSRPTRPTTPIRATVCRRRRSRLPSQASIDAVAQSAADSLPVLRCARRRQQRVLRDARRAQSRGGKLPAQAERR